MIGLVHLMDGLPAFCWNLLQGGLGLALQSTLVLGVGLLAGQRLRQRGPSVPAFVYRVTLVSLVMGVVLAIPIGGRLAPGWIFTLPASQEAGSGTLLSAIGAERRDLAVRLPEPPRVGRLNGTDVPGSHAAKWNDDLPPGPEGTPHEPGAGSKPNTILPTRTTRTGWLSVTLVSVWVTGVVVLLAGLALGHRAIGRLRKASVPATGAAQEILQGLCDIRGLRPPRLRVSSSVRSPVLTGLWQPVILLPPSYARDFDPPALRAVLAHELVHLLRADCAWILFTRLACAIGWMQPLLWMLARRLEESSEEVCDEEVVRQDTDPRVYARCLVDVAERLLPSRTERSAGAGMVSCRSAVERRIRHILSGPPWSRTPLTSGVRTTVAVGAAVVGMLGLFLASAPAAPPPVLPRGGTDGGGRGGAIRGRATLTRVRELDRRVGYTETKIPLGELVQKVAADTGAPLMAAPDVADEPVTVVVKRLPARELLEQLAELLDYTWSRRGKQDAWRYEIGQERASKQREAALRRAVLADSERRLHRQVAVAAEMARRPAAEIRTLKDDVDRREQELMKLPPEQQQAFVRSPEGRRWSERQRAVTPVAAPIPRSLASLLGRLTPRHWATLRAGQTLLLSSDPKPSELPLPPEITRRLHAAPLPEAPPGMWGLPSPPELTANDRRGWDRMRQDWAAATGYRVGLRLRADEFASTGALVLEANAAPLGGPSDPFQFGPGTELMMAISPLEANPQMTENPAERRARWAKDPILSRKETFKPPLRPRPEGPGPAVGPRWPARDLLPEIGRVYGVQFISDAYWRTGFIGRNGMPPTTVAMPLHQRLDELVGSSQWWDRKNDLIRLRSRTWFFDRSGEIPLRFVRRWHESYEKQGGLSMPQYLEMVTQLRDRQLLQLPDLAMAGALPRQALELLRTYEARRALRLYASLPVSQQQSLMAGRPLRLTEMRPRQQTLFLQAARELDRPSPRRLTDPPPDRRSTAADREHATLTLSTRRGPRRPMLPPGIRPSGSPVPSAEHDPARRAVEEWEFIFQTGPTRRQSVSITAAAALPASNDPVPSAPGTRP